ncbi:transcription factor MYBS3-like [Phragmites australis]|uniref:transcription factor MYBS3-like n=1 Tax=Phragmites australis TaxID=29695 RepID=UPI002D79B007|nr:transcription factor MYBS3-like [Phragmites australis]
MTRDGVPPPSASGGGAGGGDGPRRCSQCGHHGHNARTCTSARPVRLFGVRIGDKPIRKSASMGNIAHLGAEGSGGGREEGYGSDGEHERPHKKRGEAWTEEEHKKFLFGLNKLGKGDWRGISRSYVISRTPTQVASHAQKYFNRQTNVHRRKRRSSLFDMVIDDSSDQPLSSSSSQEVEQHLEDPQPVAAPPASVVSPAAVAPVPVETPASVPPPVPVPVPVMAPQPMEQDSVASSSSTGEAGIVMPEAMPPCLYPMMLPPPYYHPAFVPVPCYGYAPVFYMPPGVAQAPHEIVKPVAVHSKPPLNVEDLYSMSVLSLKGDPSANSGVPASPLPPKPIGRPERQSAFHGKGPAGGSVRWTNSSSQVT